MLSLGYLTTSALALGDPKKQMTNINQSSAELSENSVDMKTIKCTVIN
jgi:hypothetical protein